MSNISKILNELNLENGNKYKTTTMKKHADNDLLKRVLKMAYDKAAFTYGITVKNWHDQTGIEKVRSEGCEEMSLASALDYLEEQIHGRKITGHAAIDGITRVLASLNLEDRDVLLKVINRDLRINFGRTNINKIFPNLIIKPVYMRCDGFSQKNAKKINPKGSIIQLKADGTYREFTVIDGVVTANSRSGEDYEYPKLFEEMSGYEDGHYFGELTVVRDGKTLPRAEGNGLLNSDNPPHDEIVFEAWDYVTLEQYSEAASNKKYRCPVPYIERFDKLASIIDGSDKVKLIESHRVDSAREALSHVARWMDEGLEGGVWKCASGSFFDGTSGQQQKMKLEIEIEVRVVGFTEGTVGTVREKTFGSMNFMTDDELIKGSCSGFTNDMLEEINNNRAKYVNKVFTIRCNDITKGRDNDYYALSHPRFVEFRWDKNTTDTLDSALTAKETAMSVGVS